MKTRKIIIFHLAVWIFLLGMAVLPGIQNFDPKNLWLDLSITLARLAAFYFCYGWVFNRFLKPGKIPQLVAGTLVSFFIYVGLRAFIEEFLYPLFLGFGNYHSNTTVLYYILDNLYFGFPYVLFAASIAAIIHSLKQQEINRRLKEDIHQAQLAFLRAQINPHFLYNTLNYLYSLALPQSQQLAYSIVDLSNLMRYTLHETPDGKINIEKEINYLKSYISLFRKRFEPHFYLDFEIDGKDTPDVAALILIPFLENAFKHGVVNDPHNPIKIKLFFNSNSLHFSIVNLVNHHQKDESSGIGLSNVKRRLQFIYPEKHWLKTVEQDNFYYVSLHINL